MNNSPAGTYYFGPIQMRESKMRVATVAICLASFFLPTTGEPSSPPQNPEIANLNQQIDEFFKKNKYSEALPVATRVRELCEKILGADNPDTARALKRLALIHLRLAHYDQAEALYQRALKIEEKAFGQEDAKVAATLDDLADVYESRGQPEKAESLCERALKIREKALGPEHPLTAQSLNDLGSVYMDRREFDKAEPLIKRALQIREKALDSKNIELAHTLNLLGELYRRTARYKEAEPLYQRAMKIAETAPEKNKRTIGTFLNNQALLYQETKQPAKAEPLFQRALQMREKSVGPQHPATALSLANLGWFYSTTNQYDKAQPLLERALSIREKVLGPDSMIVAINLKLLADVYLEKSDYLKAEAFYQRALKIAEPKLGPDNPQLAPALNQLSLVYWHTQEYAKAESFAQRALTINQRQFGDDSPAVAQNLNALANIYDDLGQFSKAEPLYQRFLKINETHFGLESAAVLTPLNNLGWLYLHSGDYDKAQSAFQRGVALRNKLLGPSHADTPQLLMGLGALYDNMGDYDKAEAALKESLRLNETALGPDHRTTAASRTNLAIVYENKRDYAKAEALLEQAVKTSEKVFGPSHPATTNFINNLAGVYQRTKNYSKAKALLEHALEVQKKMLGPDNQETAFTLRNLGSVYCHLGDFAKAESLEIEALPVFEKVYGDDARFTGNVLSTLAFLHHRRGDIDGAVALAEREQRAREKTISMLLSFTSEQQRLSLQKKNQPYDLTADLGLAPQLAQIVLREKGLVLDSLLEDQLVAQTSNDPTQHQLVEDLRDSKQRLGHMLLESPTAASAEVAKRRDEEIQTLSKHVEDLESTLARQVAGLGHARRALSVTTSQVQQALGKDELLIEFVQYTPYLEEDPSESLYGAVLIPSSGPPRWVPLAKSSEIESKITLYQKSVRGETDETVLTAVLHSLYDQLWAPIERLVPANTTTMIISPDASLDFVSFATLLDEKDQFLGRKYSVRYVSSGRDLLREFKTASNSDANVYANPDFGVAASKSTNERGLNIAMRSAELRSFNGLVLSPLPGTETEAVALQKRFGPAAKVFLRSDATKAQVEQVKSPRILHIATHGFFLAGSRSESGASSTGAANGDTEQMGQGPLANPMHRSGLAFAGAQATLDAWRRGETPTLNGILTAGEVGGLKLDGTWLVVLSACDTGLGEARAGEGVMGLRRGFIQAGAQNLLMTLWPISDQTTVQIMLDFYEAAEKTKNPPKALADVQRDWLVKLRQERGLLAAVRLAGAFIMSSQGK